MQFKPKLLSLMFLTFENTVAGRDIRQNFGKGKKIGKGAPDGQLGRETFLKETVDLSQAEGRSVSPQKAEWWEEEWEARIKKGRGNSWARSFPGHTPRGLTGKLSSGEI